MNGLGKATAFVYIIMNEMRSTHTAIYIVCNVDPPIQLMYGYTHRPFICDRKLKAIYIYINNIYIRIKRTVENIGKVYKYTHLNFNAKKKTKTHVLSLTNAVFILK